MIANRSQAVSQNSQRESTWMDTAQLVVSILIFIVFFGIAILSFVGVALAHSDSVFKILTPGLWAMGFGFSILAVISLVSVIRSRQIYYGIIHPREKKKTTNGLYWSIVLLPLCILGGYFAYNARFAPEFLLPLLTILALSVAMLWFFKLGTRDKWGANPKRESGLFSLSMSFGTLYIMLLQILVVLILVAIALPFVFNNIDFAVFVEKLNIHPETQIKDLVNNTKIVFILFLAVAMIGPLIEELFKTIGVWFLKPRDISPREGWVAGLMCGAGFGLIEAFLYSAQGVLMPQFADWLYFVLGRVGGLLMHTFAGGIVGWGLAKSWREKRPWYAIRVYLLAFVLHGLWNAIAVAPAMLLSLYSIELSDMAVYMGLTALFIAVLVAFLSLSRQIKQDSSEVNSLGKLYLSQNPESDEITLGWRG